MARLVAVEGKVEEQTSGGTHWVGVKIDHVFCPGDKLRTLERSRATVELNNQTYLSLDQETTVVFSGLKPQAPSWLDLLKGALYLRSRTPSSLEIRTPYVNAAVKGTEFLVTSHEGVSHVTVLEGRVEAINSQGKVSLSNGQSAMVRAGQPPRPKLLATPQEAVQWALHYPALIDLADPAIPLREPAVRDALRFYASGDISRALERLTTVPESRRDTYYITVQVGLLLSVGRVDEAEPLLARYQAERKPLAATDALRSVIALARGQKEQALKLADTAVNSDSRSPTAWVARSYAQQAAFDLEAALSSIDQAAALNSKDALIQARRAELLAALGHWAEARQAAREAVRLHPRNARAFAVLGFADLMRMSPRAAIISFRTACRLDSMDPLPQFGLGLALIRAGDVTEGTAAIEKAASLDPSDSLIRSYLGKAYFEQKRFDIAEKEFAIAKELDPKDPTPWFYDAVMAQTQNRLPEAVHGAQKSEQLNDNRAVYRSQQTLDADLASRSASLGRIYNDIGFSQRGMVEGWKSVNIDPSNFSAHRFLADAYSQLPGYTFAKASELLQSQLFQPLNITPVQPSLGEGRLLVLDTLGPSRFSFSEFNPAYARNRFALQASGIVGSNDTYGDEVVQSGLWDQLSYSLGQYHYETDGFRANNDLRQDIYNVYLQAALTPDLNVQTEFRHRNLQHGDLNFNFDLQYFDPTFRRSLNTDSARVGLNFAPSPNSNVIGSFIYTGLGEEQSNEDGFISDLSQHNYAAEAQYVLRKPRYAAILGLGHYHLRELNKLTSDKSPADQTDGYVYTYVRFPKQALWTVGLSVDAQDDPRISQNETKVNPKLGLFWNVTDDTIFRLAAFRLLKKPIFYDQTIEPTQVAGFNQLFDTFVGTDSTRYGVAVDQRFLPNIFCGLELSLLNLQVGDINYRQYLARSYFNWILSDSFALDLSHVFESFYSFPEWPAGRVVTLVSKTHYLPANIRYFHPSGFFGSFGVTYVNQTALQPNEDPEPGEGRFVFPTSNFALLNLSLGFRLPNRYGIVTFGLYNMLDERFNFLSPNNAFVHRTPYPEQTPFFLPERTAFLQMQFAL